MSNYPPGVTGNEPYLTGEDPPAELDELDRHAGLGASEAAAALGLDPYRAPGDVWLDKRGDPYEVPQNLAMRVGQFLEEPVARLYAERTGYRVQRHRAACPEHTKLHREAFCRRSAVFDEELPWLYAHLDRIVRGQRVVEIKTHAGSGDEWGPDGTDQVPLRVAVQATLQMRLAKLARADVVAFLWGRDLRIYSLQRDPLLEAQLVEALRHFWDWSVVAGNPPPITFDHPGTSAYLAHRYPQDAKLELVADENAVSAIERLLDAREVYAEADRRKVLAENQIKALIGEAAGLVFPGGRVTWKTQGKNVIDWRAVAGIMGREEPDTYQKLVDEHTTSSTIRVLRVAETQGGAS